MGSRNQPLYLILRPRRRSKVSLLTRISGASADRKSRMSKANSNLLNTHGDQRARLSTR